MITTALAALVHAERARVWRAITVPAEAIRWDQSLLALLEPADDYPRVGQPIRWRYRLGAVPVVLADTPVEVDPAQKLHSEVSLGLFHFDQTWSLADDGADPTHTRLGLRLAARNSIPVVGGAVDRFDVRRLAAEYVDGKLRALQKWCENQ